MTLALQIAQGLLAFVYLAAGAAILAGQMNDDFERFGYPPAFRVLTGVLEVTAGVLLGAGFFVPALAPYGAALVVVLMTGAVYTHLARASDPPAKALPALVLGSLALWLAVTSWPLA
jgi:uncharacterized membrane protein YphA (DoxX/SURF4 family)